MGARAIAVLVMLVALLPTGSIAQVLGSRSSGSAFPPNGPPPRTNPSPRLNQTLPDPFASRGPNPILRPAGRDVRSFRQGTNPFGPDARRFGARDVFRAAPGTYAPRYGRLSALAGGGYYAGYVDGGYLPNGYVDAGRIDPVPFREGRLNLSVSPMSSQVFVDGLYVGTVADFQDRGLWLETGPRRIELREDGYETATFDVRILEDEAVSYRRDLPRAAAQTEAPRVTATPKTFYVIAGCYAGDAPPRTERLPKGCSARNVKTIPPVQSRLTPRAGFQNRTRFTPQ